MISVNSRADDLIDEIQELIIEYKEWQRSTLCNCTNINILDVNYIWKISL